MTAIAGYLGMGGGAFPPPIIFMWGCIMDEQLLIFVANWERLKEGRKEKFLKYLIERYGFDKHGRKNLLTYMNLIETKGGDNNE